MWEGRSFITPNDLAAVLGDKLYIIAGDVADIAIQFMQEFTTANVMGMFELSSEEIQTQGMEIIEIYSIMYQTALMQRGNFIDWNMARYQVVESNSVFDFAVNSVIGKSGYRVVVNSDGKIIGFRDLGFVLVPIPVDENATYAAEPVTIGEDTEWTLEGLLTIPNRASAENPVPALVLVHGSGANNMDSSIFDNRPFHDIATYLSSNGIAVLRYNERAWTHPEALIQYLGSGIYPSVQQEYEDAFLAIEILQNDPRISKVYVAGHSLGGFVAPSIAEESGADGVIILAGSPRPFFEIQYDQNIQAINDAVQAGLISKDEANEHLAMVSSLLEEAQNLPNLTEAEIRDMLIFGIPAIYHRSFFDILPLPVISRNVIPTLVLQPDRDFQISTNRDFNLFLEHTQGYAHVQTILYDELNHLFMPVQTDFNDTREYMITGRVDERVLRDIADWINNSK